MYKLAHAIIVIILSHFNFCCFKAWIIISFNRFRTVLQVLSHQFSDLNQSINQSINQPKKFEVS